jgi:hypothetical protein
MTYHAGTHRIGRCAGRAEQFAIMRFFDPFEYLAANTSFFLTGSFNPESDHIFGVEFLVGRF